jgi:hypothetical protein
MRRAPSPDELPEDVDAEELLGGGGRVGRDAQRGRDAESEGR